MADTPDPRLAALLADPEVTCALFEYVREETTEEALLGTLLSALDRSAPETPDAVRVCGRCGAPMDGINCSQRQQGCQGGASESVSVSDSVREEAMQAGIDAALVYSTVLTFPEGLHQRAVGRVTAGIQAAIPILRAADQREIARLEREVRAAREVEAPPTVDEQIVALRDEMQSYKDYAKRCSGDWSEATARSVRVEAENARLLQHIQVFEAAHTEEVARLTARLAAVERAVRAG